MTVLEATAVERVDRVTAQARLWRPAVALRGLLSLIAWLLIGIGRAAYAAWFAVTWSVAAVKVGWEDAQSARRSEAG